MLHSVIRGRIPIQRCQPYFAKSSWSLVPSLVSLGPQLVLLLVLLPVLLSVVFLVLLLLVFLLLVFLLWSFFFQSSSFSPSSFGPSSFGLSSFGPFSGAFRIGLSAPPPLTPLRFLPSTHF